MAGSTLELQIARSPVLRYGLAVLSVSVALGGSLLLQRFQYRNVADPLFLFAIAIAVWYAGIGPAILAVHPTHHSRGARITLSCSDVVPNLRSLYGPSHTVSTQ